MAVEFKDYYKTLGVERSASEDDLRKAFRKLARLYHPDVAKNKVQAEEKFKEINEAYEVLSDKEKRNKYDTLGADWKGGFAPPPGAGRSYRTHTGRSGGGADAGDFEFGGTGFSDFFEQFFGSKGRGGAGRGGAAFEGQDFSERGQDLESDLMVTLEEAMHGAVRPISLRRNGVCERCHGTGQMQNRVCPACGGAGQIARTEKYQVKIPAGVRGGQKLRLAGQGESGTGNGPRGDLYLRVKFAAHPDFRVEGGNIFYDIDLAPWEAALGTSVSIPTLKTPVNIKIPPGTQSGHRLRVKGRGLPGPGGASGDLYVVARIAMPKQVTEREKELWEQLAKESKFNPRD